MAKSKLNFTPVTPVKGSPVRRIHVFRGGHLFGKLWTQRRMVRGQPEVEQAWMARLATGDFKSFTPAAGGLQAAMQYMRFMEAKLHG